jgi:hypothetical protein
VSFAFLVVNNFPMKKMERLLLTASLGLMISLTATGCVAVALAGAGAGGYAYYKGEVKSTEAVSLKLLWQATRSAAAKLQLNVMEESGDGLTAILKARSADDKPITVRLERVTDRNTEMRIRAGQIDDESRARKIQEAIRAEL